MPSVGPNRATMTIARRRRPVARSPQGMGETSRGALVGRCRSVIPTGSPSCGGDSRERLHVRAQLDRLGELESEIEMAREAERTASEKAEASRQRYEQLTDSLRTHEEERERRVQEREDLRRLRPPIFRLWARAEWRDHDRRLAVEVAKLDARLARIARRRSCWKKRCKLSPKPRPLLSSPNANGISVRRLCRNTTNRPALRYLTAMARGPRDPRAASAVERSRMERGSQ